MNPLRASAIAVGVICCIALAFIDPVLSASVSTVLGITVVKSSVFELKTTAAGTEVAGDVISAYGKAWIAQFSRSPVAGEVIAWRSDQVVEIAKASGLVLADGVAVDYENSSKTAVATTTGDFALGKVRGAAGSGTTTCLVALNE